MDILAKSPSKTNRIITLLAHTQHVVFAIEAIAVRLGYDVRLARLAAILHDLGKAHHRFQAAVRDEEICILSRYPFRHELASLAFLPLIDKDDWDAIIEMVVAHHKSILRDKNERGILDLDSQSDEWVNNHLECWSDWQEHGLDVLRHFGIKTRYITITEAKDALLYSLNFCKQHVRIVGWSQWRGVLMAADHMASALSNYTYNGVQGIFTVPDLSYFSQPERLNHSLFPLSSVDATDQRQHTIVVAPTGSGKTDYLLRRCRGRVFYTLPFQASINSMFERLIKAVPSDHVRVLHATSKLVENATNRHYTEKYLQDKVGASIKVLTPHQLASIVFGSPGFESILLDLQGCDVILDEIHTYADSGQAMVLAIVDVLARIGCRVHVGTATMPTHLYNEILLRLGKENTHEISLPDVMLDNFNRHIIHKVSNPYDEAIPKACNTILEQAFERGEKVIIACNTVKAAQEEFIRLRIAFPAVKSMLLHSRFRRIDRTAREHQLIEFEQATEPCFVVSTQIIEVSLDISFDLMITQTAPIDALVQRFGRVNRRRTSAMVLKSIYVIEPSVENGLPYDMELLRSSFAILPHNVVLAERGIQAMIDAVYPTLVVSNINKYVVWLDGEVATLSKLTNNTHSHLVEALNISSANCILATDKDEYIEAGWERQIELTIPVNWLSFKKYASSCEQIKAGINPFVIQLNLDIYNEAGLVLTGLVLI